MIAFDAYNAPRIIYGEGVSKNVSALLKSLGVKTVMAVYDEGIKKVGIADSVLDPIREAGFVVEEFGGVTADPPVEMIEEAAKIADEKNVDIYIAIGGGGVIDTTKCMAVMHTNPGKLLDYVLGVGKPIPNACPHVIAVPTTSGTGSEVTALSIVTDTETHRKVCIKDVVKMCPYAAYLDPALTTGLPKGLTASTGMDALSHAVEAYLVGRHNEYADMFCENGIRRVIKWAACCCGRRQERGGPRPDDAGCYLRRRQLRQQHPGRLATLWLCTGGSPPCASRLPAAWGLNFDITHCARAANWSSAQLGASGVLMSCRS